MTKTAELILSTDVKKGTIGLWWLGQSGFALKGPDGTIIYIDPYITDTIFTGYRPYIHARLLPPVVEAFDPVPVTSVLYTHEHMDHFDPDSAVQLAYYTNAQFYGGDPVEKYASACKIPEDRFVNVKPYDIFDCGEFHVTVTPALHSVGACGYMVEAEGICLYFCGDSVLTYDMISIGEKWNIDYAFLCFNGQGGNMDIRGCLCAIDMLKPKHVIPDHYGMYIDNDADPEKLKLALKERFAEIDFIQLTPGEIVILN